MKPKKIMCPECAKRGIRSWLASSDGLKGDGYLLLWCKRCKKEIRIPLKDIADFEARGA